MGIWMCFNTRLDFVSISAYCITENFRENLIFANSVKRHSCDAKNSRLVHDLPISVIDGVISRGFYFQETLHMKIPEFTVCISDFRENFSLIQGTGTSVSYVHISSIVFILVFIFIH